MANLALATAAVAILAATPAVSAPHVEADPHELYERASGELAEGELQQAAATLARLRALIDKRPSWDPEGVFAKQLLPPLHARLSRLQGVARQLDEFSERSLEELKPPDLKKDISTVRDYTDWATAVIQKLHAQRDEIIAAGLDDPEDRTVLSHTESYVRTERLLEVDVLKRIAEAAGDDILGLLGGDPQLESVLVRFRQLKRDLMQIVAERDQLQKDAKAAQQRTEEVLDALLTVVTDRVPAKENREAGRPAGVADRFRRFLDDERQALEQRRSLSTPERETLLANIGRYRRYNEVLRKAGLGLDEGAKIDTLEKVVTDLPLKKGVGLSGAPAAGRIAMFLAGALALAAAFLAWLAIDRGRRLKALQAGLSGAGRNADAGIKAA